MVEMMGTDVDAGGESRRALKSKAKEAGFTEFKFVDEFAIKPGDLIRESATENYFAVIDAEAESKAGVFHHFRVTTQRE